VLGRDGIVKSASSTVRREAGVSAADRDTVTIHGSFSNNRRPTNWFVADVHERRSFVLPTPILWHWSGFYRSILGHSTLLIRVLQMVCLLLAPRFSAHKVMTKSGNRYDYNYFQSADHRRWFWILSCEGDQ
jgi:hypothetical protein